jgi:ATP-dependent Clp protease ATP-binding subunit ClpX
VKRKSDKDMLNILEQVQPQDLIKYGLIPEFVGRLPVIGLLGELDKEALVRILTEPRNALTKQYQRIFEYEDVTLTFTKDALEAVAEKALGRKIGARGLRLILEDLMLDLMYQLPSQNNITECVISREVVENKVAPIILMEKAG